MTEGSSVIVVDTPPAQSSIEILDAPARLVRFLDQRVVRWFLQASGDSAQRSRGTLTQRLLRTVAGDSLVSSLTEFLTEMSFLREGFAARATEVQALMRSRHASFILVSSADSVGLQAARSVAAEVIARDFQLAHVVFNRAFIAEASLSDRDPPEYPARLAKLAPKLAEMHIALAEEQERKRSNIEAFRAEHPVEAWALPEATRTLGNPAALASWIEQGRSQGP